MSLFKRDYDKPLSPGQDAQAERIAGRIIIWQKRMAGYLNAKTQGISAKMWLWLLVGFCLVFGCYCLQLVISVWD